LYDHPSAQSGQLFDLSALSDSELVFLRRTVLKARQVNEEE
jgi:hypothetical protein